MDAATKEHRISNAGDRPTSLLPIQSELERALIERDASLFVLDRVQTGAVLVDRYASSLAFNQTISKLFQEGDALFLCHGRLHARKQQDTNLLHSAIARASETASENWSGKLFPIHRVDGSRLALLISPMPCPARADRAQGTIAAVLVRDSRHNPKPVTADLRSLYHLTSTEAHLAVELVSGVSLHEAARHRGVSLHTVKSQLKSIMLKTGTARQAELTRVILQTTFS